MTAEGLNSKQLLHQEQELKLPALMNKEAIEIGQLASELGKERKLPIAIEVRIGNWIVYHASLPGSSPENDRWIERKVAVVMLNQHSTIFERVSAEERGVDWHKENGVTDETHAIHGGAIPLITDEGFKGILIISGLPQVEDHLLAVEVLTEFLARKGELL
ncbi:MAG: hypothetical protein EXQ73_05220 [Candidatus Nanopelagicaceae bacterium]|nr:hypothetical protein [Candidatus Nanopelagicaceae bacterium]